jgi:glycerophosphoryl diester phosphodiesterase
LPFEGKAFTRGEYFHPSYFTTKGADTMKSLPTALFALFLLLLGTGLAVFPPDRPVLGGVMDRMTAHRPEGPVPGEAAAASEGAGHGSAAPAGKAARNGEADSAPETAANRAGASAAAAPAVPAASPADAGPGAAAAGPAGPSPADAGSVASPASPAGADAAAPANASVRAADAGNPAAPRHLLFVGHRGMPSAAPENTLPSFRAAIDHGADFLEFDMQATADGKIVIMHDPSVDRTTDGKGLVRDQTLRQLRGLDAGIRYGPAFRGTRIPTLDEVLELAKAHNMPVLAEIKGYRTPGDISLMIQKLLDAGFERRAVIEAFNFADFRKVREKSREMTLCYLADNPDTAEDAIRKAAEDGHATAGLAYPVVLAHPEFVRLAAERHVELYVWTVDTEDTLQKLQELGITRIITNRLLNGHRDREREEEPDRPVPRPAPEAGMEA